MSRTPPVPESQQSDIIHGEHSPPDRKPEVKRDPAGGTAGENLKEQGAAGDRYQNLTAEHRVQEC